MALLDDAKRSGTKRRQMALQPCACPVAGFTRIELLVTLSVAVVLIAVSARSFQKLIYSNRLATAANDLVGNTSSFEGQAVDICTAEISTDNHHIVEVAAGTIVTVTKGSGSCP